MKPTILLSCLTVVLLNASLQANDSHDDRSTGAIYTMDNAAGANQVLVFRRAENGSLIPAGSYVTGGAGTGSGLASQGSVLLSRNGHWLFACNAGSDEIAVFAVTPQGLQLADRVNSGGRRPLSLTLHQNLLYVLNAGGSVGEKDNITAFLFAFGKLWHGASSTRLLSGDNTGPAQVSFTRDGRALIVTERTSSLIDTFSVDDDGAADGLQMFVSAGLTPFGFAVGRHDRLYVSEAGGGAADGSSASSYELTDEGALKVVSSAVPTTETAACWIVLTDDDRFAYTANAGAGSISGYRVDNDGRLRLLTPGGRTAVTGAGSHPVDLALSRKSQYLYSLNNGNGTIGAFRVNGNGSLESLAGASGIPASAAGLAAE